jgi:DNA-binding transcriptional MerR regulator
MNDYIKISELSRLMNVSVHQIRYFEEKGVLYPAYIDTNQYRMYGVTEIYQLSQILLLRKLNIPVHQIKESMMYSSPNDYHNLLKNSLEKVASDIEELLILKHFIQRTLKEHTDYKKHPDYQVRNLNLRHLKIWIECEEKEELSARNLYEERMQVPNLFESDLHYLYKHNKVALCFESSQSSDVKLEKGKYLTKLFLVTEDNDIAVEIQKIQHYIEEHEYLTSGEFVVVEKSYLSIFDNTKLLYEIQVKIGE